MDMNLLKIQDMFLYLNIKNTVFECHAIGTSNLTYLISDSLNLDIDNKKLLYYAAYLHDIGQVAISESLLEKKEPLNEQEMELLKTHVDKTVSILYEMDIDQNIIDIVKHHHERLNGTGYPSGISDLNLNTRILTIADTADALLTGRSYRQAREMDYVGDLLLNSGGFDKHVARIALDILSKNTISQKNELILPGF